MFFLRLLLMFFQFCDGAKVLLIPLDHSAHVDIFVDAGTA